jgi:hypothetical protein
MQRMMRVLSDHGCTVLDHGGVPQSHSAIPLTFTVYAGELRLTDGCRLRDLVRAVERLETC